MFLINTPRITPKNWCCVHIHDLAFFSIIWRLRAFLMYMMTPSVVTGGNGWQITYTENYPNSPPSLPSAEKLRLIGRQMHSQDLWGIPRWESLVGNWVELFSSLFLFNCNSWLAQFKTWISDELVIPLIDVQTRNQEFFRAGKFFRNLGT